MYSTHFIQFKGHFETISVENDLECIFLYVYMGIETEVWFLKCKEIKFYYKTTGKTKLAFILKKQQSDIKFKTKLYCRDILNVFLYK